MSRPLRIGLVCPYSFDAPGGVQSHVLGLARYLTEAGHAPYLLAPGELDERARQVFEPSRFTSAGAAVPVPYNGSIARVNFGALSAARVGRWLRSGDFDLVHIQEPVTPSISMLALWAAEIPVVATFHTATPRSRSMQLAGGLLRPAIAKIDAGIAVSESARLVVVQHLGRDAVVIPNGLWFDDFSAGPIDRPRRLVFLGRVDEPRKGLETLLAAAPRIRAAYPELEIVVAGQGHRPLPSWCRSLGPIDDLQKVALLAGAEVFVAPHLERESFGIVLLEAMASRAAVVASDLAPFAELLTGAPAAGPVGRLFPAGDPAALAGAVIETLDRPDPARLERARLRAASYDWHRVGPAVVAVYRAALAADRLPGATRTDRTWAALDAALIRRAERAVELAYEAGTDPASALLLLDSAAAALDPQLGWTEREQAESDLTAALRAVSDITDSATELSRRLHNDAVATARSRRRRAEQPRTFEMADEPQLLWPRDG